MEALCGQAGVIEYSLRNLRVVLFCFFFLFFVWDKISPSSTHLPLTHNPFALVSWVLSEIPGHAVDIGLYILSLVWGRTLAATAAECNLVWFHHHHHQQQQKAKEILQLNDVKNQMNPTDIYRTFHPRTKEYILFSSCGIFSKINDMLEHTASLNRY